MNPATAYLMYLVFALGGAGVYFLLPQAGRSRPLTGGIIGLLALAALIAVVSVRIVADGTGSFFFYLFAAITVTGSVRVITHPRPVYSALYFVLTVVAVAGLLVLQHAEFLAVALIIIYAGAILVTYLFVIMLAHQGGSPIYDRRSREPFGSVLAGFLLMAVIATRAAEAPAGITAPGGPPTATLASTAGEPIPRGNTFAIGAAVMTRHVVVLELSGLLLLISMIGAIALSRKKVPVEVITAPAAPLGQVGREAKPF